KEQLFPFQGLSASLCKRKAAREGRLSVYRTDMVDLFDNLSFGRLYEVGPIVAGDSRGEKELRGRWSAEILRISTVSGRVRPSGSQLGCQSCYDLAVQRRGPCGATCSGASSRRAFHPCSPAARICKRKK